MNADHKLRSGVFELSAISSENSTEIQHSLNNILQTDLSQILSEVFEEVCDENQRIKIETLDLDLGDIALHSFEADVKSKLKQELRLQLRRLIEIQAFSDNIKVEYDSNDQIITESLEFYLKNGFLPWNSYSDLHNESDLVRYLEQVIINNPVLIRELIRKEIEYKSSLNRLFQLFPSPDKWIDFCFQINSSSAIQRHKSKWKEILFFISKRLPSNIKSSLFRISGYNMIRVNSDKEQRIFFIEQIRELIIDLQKENSLTYNSIGKIVDVLEKHDNLKTHDENHHSEIKVLVNDAIDTIVRRTESESLVKKELSFSKLENFPADQVQRKKIIENYSFDNLIKLIAEREPFISRDLAELNNVLSRVNISGLKSEALKLALKEAIFKAVFRKVDFGEIIKLENILKEVFVILAPGNIPLQQQYIRNIIHLVTSDKGSQSLRKSIDNVSIDLNDGKLVTNAPNDIQHDFRMYLSTGVISRNNNFGGIYIDEKSTRISEIILIGFREYIMDLAQVFRSMTKPELITAFQRIEIDLEDEFKGEIIKRISKIMAPQVVLIAQSLLTVPESLLTESQKEIITSKILKDFELVNVQVNKWARESKKPVVINLKLDEFLSKFIQESRFEAIKFFKQIPTRTLNFIKQEVAPEALQQMLEELDILPENLFGFDIKNIKGLKEETSQTSSSSDQQESSDQEESRLQEKNRESDKNEIRKKSESGYPIDDQEIIKDPIFIKNAGIVLLAPYLTRLFDLTGLLGNKKEFSSNYHQEKACYLMHYLATGLEEGKEYMMTLNKLIAGIPLGVPFVENIVLDEKDKETADGLLKGVISNWTALKKSSPENLRGSFLLREGKLTHNDKFWDLRVEERGYDLLIDKVPWSFKVIRFPWMNKPIHVTWR
ncbi:contractile injection system tape measure protein [Marinigracilibium pacificum]|uniref:Uncharacterized protein n=1 Tax=Marinigracilibium pacificum TaxID=2729599 RepID=A0A848IYW0_9BACT|nr:contractile injection system tape measure protein [Marinigracilibium pacificum]NMM48465.1 hypothetical protein [Marinigracilibium pacificum]